MLIAKDMVGYRGGRDVTVDEFSSSPEDRPLIAQLAAHDPVVGAIASERLAPVCQLTALSVFTNI